MREVLNTIGTLLIAAATAFGTWWLTSQKTESELTHTQQDQENNDIRLVVDMVATNDPIHRIMAHAIAKSYAGKRIPVELFEAVNAYVSTNNTLTQQQQDNAVTSQIKTSPAATQAVQNAASGLPIRVYIQYQRIDDLNAVEDIRQRLNGQQASGKSIIAPPIENVKATIGEPVLKCFRESECSSFGQTLVDKLKESGAPPSLKLQRISGFENSTQIRPNHFEAWFGPLRQ
jgi:hypothetical protein